MKYLHHTELPTKDEIGLVSKENLGRVKQDAKEMIKLCFKRHGRHPSAHAIAHLQVTKKSLRFFVTKLGRVFINPEIIERSEETFVASEGCMSFPETPNGKPLRHRWVEVRYQTIDGVLTGEWITETIDGVMAQIVQHEDDHFNGIVVYDYNEDLSPE